jgi:hypothetical protein
MSSCGVTVTSLSLCIFNCGLPSFVLFQEFSGCGTWLFSPYSLLRGVTVVYVFSRRVCVVEWCRVSACLITAEVLGGKGAGGTVSRVVDRVYGLDGYLYCCFVLRMVSKILLGKIFWLSFR